MKSLKYILPIAVVAVLGTACEGFLDKEPLVTPIAETFYKDDANAVLAVNAIYDAISWDEGGVTGSGHTYEWMYGDLLSDDSKKGSTTGDYLELKQMETWQTLTNAPVQSSTWNNMYVAIYRANQVLTYLGDPQSVITEDLKSRLMGEAYFLRAYSYFNLVTKYGGVPVVTELIPMTDWGKYSRSSVAEVYQQIESDLKEAINRLPEKGTYTEANRGRATKGAAKAYLARAYMYQLGTDNTNGITWQQVYTLTNEVITSGQYQLMSNYAMLFEIENENNAESVFELQFVDVNNDWGPGKTGTGNNVIQNNRATWGWGFNNPTQNLVDAFEDNDPRLAVTVYTSNDTVVGTLQQIDYPGQNETGYLNRKAFLATAPSASSSSPKNIIKFRYADILLMQAEAAYHLGQESTARDLVNQVRARARVSTRPKGSAGIGASDYRPYPVVAGRLPDVTASGTALLDAILHERRVELAMEGLRYYDLVRTGRYFTALANKYSQTEATRAESRSIKTGVVNPIPVMPIPLTEVQSWGLTQNPGY
ncbi:RagB/SusD family nutrient uptake outer membrane protein [Xanthocytophaga flava]|uniref:RagB/SusD family nutrient uptake outer membrane protein n=1 Tax=Xanthocytophaga flava TaxID=3048013 RepID=UPI0028D159A3|nr:RagB/SusD family nutrient uptake outer membrane protein [Xanthocytophaga flavus]MDJ1473639.1 RagB/SusD family nutrient uptake outer membrane protein [Xanthocytophaga flavus]